MQSACVEEGRRGEQTNQMETGKRKFEEITRQIMNDDDDTLMYCHMYV